MVEHGHVHRDLTVAPNFAYHDALLGTADTVR
jgi:hypothetical protein